MKELRDFSNLALAEASAAMRLSGSFGRSSWNCAEAQSDLRRVDVNVEATSSQISESAGKRREVASSSRREREDLSSFTASKTASATLVEKGFGES